MADKFVTLLEDVGKDIVKGVSKVLPLVQAEAPIVSALDPALGSLFSLTVGVLTKASQVAQNVASVPAGTTLTESSDVLQIVGPTVAQAFAAAGKPSDAATVSKYVTAVESFLNAIPASNVVVSGKG